MIEVEDNRGTSLAREGGGWKGQIYVGTKKHIMGRFNKGNAITSGARSALAQAYDNYKHNRMNETSELKMGIKDEMEHTSSKKEAKKIAQDHLAKHSDYYSRLKKAGLAEMNTKPLINNIGYADNKKPDPRNLDILKKSAMKSLALAVVRSKKKEQK